MEQSQPSFVPEWYKGISGGATSNNNFNHYNGSSHSETDEHIRGFSSRNRFSVSACDRDALRSLSFTDKTSSFRRSACSNGSMGREKDLPSRAYSSFGRNHRDRDRDSEKDLDFHDRDGPLFLDNGFSSHPDSLIANKSEKDSLRRSHSMVSGRLVSGHRVDPWLRRPGHDLINGVPSVVSIVTGISKTSFEKDFPSLGAEEKYVGSDVPRVSSPGLSTAIHNLPVTASAIIGGDGWTSALAEVPSVVGGGNSPMVLSALPTSPTLAAASSTSTGLNMAETLAQAPARVRTSPQLPSDSQKIEELHRQQILKLRPVTPSMPKTLCLNSADKSKTKGVRTEFNTSKVGQQPSSQLVIHALRPAAVRSDVSKTSQPGNFQVLNRERNGLSPTGNKDSPNPTNISRVSTVPSGILPAAIPPPKTPVILKLKVDGRGGALNPTLFGEKKPPSQSRDRNDFFNSLRKKTYASQHSNGNDDLSCDASSSNLDKVSEPFAVDSDSAKNKKGMSSSNANLQNLMENGDYSTRACDVFEEPEKLAPDEEEAAFLRSLGWEENAGEEALTREEIESFLSEYNKRRPAPKLKI